MFLKLIARSVKSAVQTKQNSFSKCYLSTTNIFAMRELLLSNPSSQLAVKPQNSGKNESIKTLLTSSDNKISIELSPNDFNADLLSKLAPQFCSITWLGNRYLELPTHEIPAVALAKKLCNHGYSVLLHLAGRNVNKSRLLEILHELKNADIKNILAVQGDWPHVLEKDDSNCDFPYASDLVSFIKNHFENQFCIGVAGYPDIHPHCSTAEKDMEFLYQKVSQGADFIVTQAVFEYEVLENFAKSARKKQINIPILPGIFIIKSQKLLLNMIKFCDFKVPQRILDFVEKHKDKEEVIQSFGLDLATELIQKILGNSELFAGVHIFSMNDMEIVEKVAKKIQSPANASALSC